MSVCNNDIELQVTKMMLPETRDSYIVNTYRPISGDASIAIETLTSIVTEIQALNTPDILVLGDMNIYLEKNDKWYTSQTV